MDIKTKVIKELQTPKFPDLKLIYSQEALDVALEILKDALAEEKKDFKNLLKKESKELTFESFEDTTYLSYYWNLLNHYDNVSDNEKLREIIEKFRPLFQDFGNEVAYNKHYFKHLKYVYENKKLTKEQKRILFLRIKAFKDRGIDLSEKKQKRLKELNKKIGKLTNKFGNNVTDDEKRFSYLIENFDVIKDLPKEVLDITKEAGKGKGYLFDSDPTSHNAIMKYCSDRNIRKDFEKKNYTLASKGKFDNRKNVLKILEYRNEKAKILGYKNYSELSLNYKMADSPKEIEKLLKTIHRKAFKKAKEELKYLKKYYKLDELKSYDLAYYSRKLKEEKYKINDKDLKKYFEFESVLNYLHRFIEKFYCIEIKQTKIISYDKDVRVYEIYKDKKLISYYVLDPYYRKGKGNGAWCADMREINDNSKNSVPIIVNVCNFQKALKGKTTLYLIDVETLFHEFGHGVHWMLSNTQYGELFGYNIEWDFSEVPSQLLENWVKESESLKMFAVDEKTGKKIDDQTVQKLENIKKFMIGNFLTKQSELGLIDIILYSSKPPKTVKELDKDFLKLVNKYSLFERKKDYKMYTHFGHIFEGAYGAGYYSYMWSEIYEADIFNKVKKLGMFESSTGKKLYDTIIGQGFKKDAKNLFYDFMKRDVNDRAFLERYGL